MARRYRKSRKSISDGAFILLFGGIIGMYLLSTRPIRIPNINTEFLNLILIGVVIIALLTFISFQIRRYIERRAMKVRIAQALYFQKKEDFLSLHHTTFEKLVGDILEAKGYETEHTGKTGDHGIDTIARKDGKTYAVQAKRYKENVSEPELRNFFGSHFPQYDGGFFATSSDFTQPARDWVKGRNITLINGEQLLKDLKSADIKRFLYE